MNNRRHWVGPDLLSHTLHNVIVVFGLLFFAYVGGQEVYQRIAEMLAVCGAQ